MGEEEMTRAELLRENQRLRAALAEARGDPSLPEAVSQRREAERKVTAERVGPSSLFREAFHLGPAGLVVTRLSDGTIIEANEQFSCLSGYERGELIGHSSLELDLWMSDRLRRVALGRLRTHGEILNVEFRLRTKTGSGRWMLGSCRLLRVGGDECLLVSCIDVTERRRAEASERESQELFRRIFHLSPAGIALSRLSDGGLIDVNPELCRLFGYERSELLDTAILGLDLWISQEKRDELVERLRADGVVHDYEFTLRTRGGRLIDLLGSFQRLEVGGEDTVLSVVSDISARKQAETALRQAKEEAEELAQFRSSVIANITHEVRTPLTVILGFTSILREGVSEHHRRFVDLIERSGRRLLLTLDSVLDLAQLQSGTLEVNRRLYNLVDVIDSVASTVRTLAQEKELRLETHLPDRPLYANVDYELLTRALNHLVDNAIKFTEEGGIMLGLHSDGDHVHIDVQDTGIGIEENFQAQLFEMFSQESVGLERSYQGVGVGLTVTGGLVERLGGEIRVQSEKGSGSTFTILLPRANLEDADTGNGVRRVSSNDGAS